MSTPLIYSSKNWNFHRILSNYFFRNISYSHIYRAHKFLPQECSHLCSLNMHFFLVYMSCNSPLYTFHIFQKQFFYILPSMFHRNLYLICNQNIHQLSTWLCMFHSSRKIQGSKHYKYQENWHHRKHNLVLCKWCIWLAENLLKLWFLN